MHVKTAPVVWTCNAPDLRCHSVFIRPVPEYTRACNSPAEHLKDTPQSLPGVLKLTHEAVINAHAQSWLNKNGPHHKPSAFFQVSWFRSLYLWSRIPIEFLWFQMLH